MGTHIREEAPCVAYHFFQWARLCDEKYALSQRCFFESSRSLVFSPGDFSNTLSNEACIEVHFLSLLGASSPLPNYFNMAVLEESSGSEALYGFIALLNRIFYRALYASWKSKHPHFFIAQRGMYHEIFSLYANTPWIARAYVQYMPNLMGVRCLLYRLCEGVPFDVQSEWGYQALSSGLCRLGKNDAVVRLSDNAILGDRILSHEGRLSITIGPLPCAHAKAWLSSEAMGKKVLYYLKRYLGVGYVLTWHLLIAAQETQACLGAGDGLSRHAFLGRSLLEKRISYSVP